MNTNSNNQLNLKVIRDVSNYYALTNKYTCSDQKVHVRLKHYLENNYVITGFVNKLSFLLQYLFLTGNNFSVKTSIQSSEDYSGKDDNTISFFDNVIANFKTSPEYRLILNSVLLTIPNCKDIKIYPAYSKRVNVLNHYMDLCGSLPTIIGLTNVEPIPGKEAEFESLGRLGRFLDTLNLSLEEYLYNDNIELWLTTKGSNVAVATRKFRNKAAKVLSKKLSEKEEFNPVNLFEDMLN